MAFSPSGESLAFTGHDSTITVVSPGTGDIQSIRAPYLPYLSVIWLNENQIVAAGHDCAPHLFELKGQQWYVFFSGPFLQGGYCVVITGRSYLFSCD